MKTAPPERALYSMMNLLLRPDVILTIALGSISILASLYSSEIRTVMKIPGQKRREAKLRSFIVRINLLERLYGDPYQLLLWTLSQIFSLANWFLGLELLRALFEVYIAPHYPGVRISRMPLMFGFALGRFVYMHEVYVGLQNYPETIKRFSTRMQLAGFGPAISKALPPESQSSSVPPVA